MSERNTTNGQAASWIASKRTSSVSRDMVYTQGLSANLRYLIPAGTLMIRPTWGLWYWPAFMLITLAMFAPAETIALMTNPQNTLSDFAWKEFGFPSAGYPHSHLYTAAWYFSFASYIAVAVFLGYHIWFERLR